MGKRGSEGKQEREEGGGGGGERIAMYDGSGCPGRQGGGFYACVGTVQTAAALPATWKKERLGRNGKTLPNSPQSADGKLQGDGRRFLKRFNPLTAMASFENDQ